MSNKPRRPWLAALLTLIATGLGHLYAGKPKRGLILFAIQICLTVVLCIFIIVVPNIFIIIIFLIGAFAFAVYCVVDAFSIAKRNKENYEPAKYNRWFVYAGYAVILGLLLQLATEGVKAGLVKAYKIPARSMIPSLLVGDHFLVNKFIYGVKIPLSGKTIISVSEPKRGDVIVFLYPRDRNREFIKRVIGVGGDKIEIKNKKIFINDREFKDLYGVFSDTMILPASMQPRDNFGPVTVPEKSIFVMGDNRDESLDSRFWGFVDLKDVVGKAYMVYFSWNRDEHEVRWARLGHLIK
jgi:signal peptidase I